MKIGADRLLEARQAQYGYGSYRLLLVTDGQATDGNLTTLYAPLILARAIAVDVIGVDMAEDHLLATKVNSYRRANDPRALSRAIREVFAEVGRSSTGGGAEDEAFADLAGLPTEAATAMVMALAASGNDPIGSPPGTPPVTTNAGAALAPVQVPAPAPAPQPSSPRHPPWVLIFAFGFLGLIFLSAVRSASSAARRPRPRRR
jgi:hypothetical protein